MVKSVFIKIITAWFFIGTVFQPNNSHKDISKINETLEKIKDHYKSDFHQFQDEVHQLLETSQQTSSKIDIEALQNQLTKTRLAFKRVEFIFDYDQTSYNSVYVNGAPLYKIDPDFGGETVFEPNGLQTLDEEIFSYNPLENIEHIQKLAEELKKRVDFIANIHLPIKIVENSAIEALRSGVIRVFTLGLSGFDTPGSANILEEAIVSFESMHSTFQMFEPSVMDDAKADFEKVNSIYEKGTNILKSQKEMDNFDHLIFLKTIINPLYAQLLQFQKSNNISLKRYKYHAQNINNDVIFDESFLDTDYYGYFTYLPLSSPASIKLGKKLFEDPILSNDGKMSCVTCHNPKKGFSDGLPKSSTNKNGVANKRNSPGLIDIGYSKRFFWDLRDHNLEKQVAHVVDNNLEFNTSFKTIASKLNRISEYRKLFDEAYGDISKDDINKRSISNAIAAYVNSLKSFNSEFDQFVRDDIDTYPEDAYRGFNLFMGKAACATCHFAPVFNGTVPPFYIESESEVLGVTVGLDSINPKLDEDLGRVANGMNLDKHWFFRNSFKTVTVRNIELTAPYMHNGSFNTLEEVIDFYNLGGGKGMGLDVENQTLSDAPLGLNKREKADLVAFLKTLTDTTGLTQKTIPKVIKD
ncbi:MAG: cytochrome c peroxidase [Flavobacteriaceae bacterium]|nr:cytochrome-c peroxidase [Flavobacteriaceae bacterium]